MLRVKNHFQKTRLPETKTSFSKIMNKPLCQELKPISPPHGGTQDEFNGWWLVASQPHIPQSPRQDVTAFFNVLSTCLADLLDCFHTHKTFYAKREKKKFQCEGTSDLVPLILAPPPSQSLQEPFSRCGCLWWWCAPCRGRPHTGTSRQCFWRFSLRSKTQHGEGQRLHNNRCLPTFACFLFFVFFWTSLTVSCWLAVFRGKINTAANAPPWMRHDSQAALQDGRHHRYVCSVPQQTAVLQSLVLTEPLSLRNAAKF